MGARPRTTTTRSRAACLLALFALLTAPLAGARAPVPASSIATPDAIAEPGSGQVLAEYARLAIDRIAFPPPAPSAELHAGDVTTGSLGPVDWRAAAGIPHARLLADLRIPQFGRSAAALAVRAGSLTAFATSLPPPHHAPVI